jgi:hypothetical protein
MDTFSLLIALFLKLNSLVSWMPEHPGDYAAIEAWLAKVTPVYADMGLMTTSAVLIAEVPRPADVPEDVAVWVESEKGYYKPPIYYVGDSTEHPLSIRAGIAHDFLHLQTRYLGRINGVAKQVQYEQIAETGMMAALAILANEGDLEARQTLMHSLWERSIVSALYQALAAGGVEQAERLLTSFGLDAETHARFHRVIELWQEQPKTSRTLDSMYYNGVLVKVLEAEDGIVTGIGAPGGSLDVSELQEFIRHFTYKPPVPKLLGRHADEAADRWSGCAQ